jgi:hypothetical protein
LGPYQFGERSSHLGILEGIALEIKNEGVYNFRVNYLDYSCSYEKRASRDCPAAATAATGRPRKTGQVHNNNNNNNNKNEWAPGV